MNDTWFFGHPKGLMTLFFTEAWERFSYYGMRAFLLLFMVAPVDKGGLGFTAVKGGMVYGLYTATVYLLSLPGGWIADRFLGQRRAVLYGGILIMFGHISLAVPMEPTFYLGLGLIVLGTGLLKPNISTMVGQLYAPDDVRRDGGFSIYYMGINLGATLAPLACGWLVQSDTFREVLSGYGIAPNHVWHFGFGAAALGMFIGIVQYVLGDRALGEAGRHPVPAESPEAAARNRRMLGYVALATFGLPAAIAGLAFSGILPLTAASLGVFILGILISILVLMFAAIFTFGTWTSAEKRRLVLVMLLCFGAVVFFGVFEQAGSTFNLFADRHTTNVLLGVAFPSTFLQSANAIFIIIFAPVFGWLWTYLGRRGKNPSSTAKFAMGMFFLAAGCLVMLPAAGLAEGGEKAGAIWLILLYLLHTFAELCISPVGLSSMTKLAPARIGAMVMGLWFAGTAVGNYLSGLAAGLNEMGLSYPKLFMLIAGPPIVAGLIFVALIRPMRRLIGHEPGTSSAAH